MRRSSRRVLLTKRAAVLAAVLVAASLPASAAAQPAWLPPVQFATVTNNDEPTSFNVAVSPSGAAVIVWAEDTLDSSSLPSRIMAMYRSPGGQFSAPQRLSTPDTRSLSEGGIVPRAAINDAGTAVVSYVQRSSGHDTVVYRIHGATGDWGPVQTPPGQNTAGYLGWSPELALNGDRIALEWGVSGVDPVVMYGAKGTLADVPAAVELQTASNTSFKPSAPVIDESGNAVFAWERTFSGGEPFTRYLRWPAGGGPGATSTFNAGVRYSRNPRLSSDGAGHVRLVAETEKSDSSANGLSIWSCDLPACTWVGTGLPAAGTGGSTLASVAVVPGGTALVGYRSSANEPFVGVGLNGESTFSALTRLNPSSGFPKFAATANQAVAVFNGAPPNLFGVVRSPDTGAFATTKIAEWSGANSRIESSAVDVDDQGNAVAAYGGYDCSSGTCSEVARYAQYDAAAPALGPVSIPSAANAGAAVPFSASASDRVSAIAYAWDFGDGATGSGGDAQHAYAAPGTYTVKVTATDAAGNSSSTSGSVVVSGAPGGGVKPAQVSAAASASWKTFKGYTTVKKLVVKSIPAGATVYVKCTGGKKLGCPLKKTKKFKFKKASKSKDLTSLFKPHRRAAKLKPKARVEIGISAPSLLGRFTTWTFQAKKKKPKVAKGCLAVGSTKKASC